MKKMILFDILALLLSSCNRELEFVEVDVKNVNHQVREMIQRVENVNGNYYVTGEKEQYVFIDRMNKVDGDKTVTLSELTFEVRQGVLNISFSEQLTADDSAKGNIYQRLYKVTGKGDYNTVLLTRDGETLPFDSVLGR